MRNVFCRAIRERDLRLYGLDPWGLLPSSLGLRSISPCVGLWDPLGGHGRAGNASGQAGSEAKTGSKEGKAQQYRSHRKERSQKLGSKPIPHFCIPPGLPRELDRDRTASACCFRRATAIPPPAERSCTILFVYSHFGGASQTPSQPTLDPATCQPLEPQPAQGGPTCRG